MLGETSVHALSDRKGSNMIGEGKRAMAAIGVAMAFVFVLKHGQP